MLIIIARTPSFTSMCVINTYMYMLDIYAAGHEQHIQPMIKLVILVLTLLVYLYMYVNYACTFTSLPGSS